MDFLDKLRVISFSIFAIGMLICGIFLPKDGKLFNKPNGPYPGYLQHFEDFKKKIIPLQKGQIIETHDDSLILVLGNNGKDLLHILKTIDSKPQKFRLRENFLIIRRTIGSENPEYQKAAEKFILQKTSTLYL